jgi:hypothetical protein
MVNMTSAVVLNGYATATNAMYAIAEHVAIESFSIPC